LFIAMLPVIAYLSKVPSVSATHPLCRLATRHTGALVIYEAALLLYVSGWEFFFRGFLLFGLKKPLGEGAIYLQALPYALMYLDGPRLQTLGAIPGGIALGYLASRTGSIWYGVALHWLCALALDWVIIYRPF
jgi:membrane protease YdiL (CAAX protease family)